MKVDVDTHERGAARLQRLVREEPVYETKAFDIAKSQADERIERIIAENAGPQSFAAGTQAARGGSRTR